MEDSKDWEEENQADPVLSDLRKRIEDVDRQFASLLSERQKLAGKIVARKVELGLPLRNYTLENRIIERFAELCRARGVEPRWGVDLASFLIAKSVEAQSNVLERRRNGNRLKVLVAGGLGKMGRWMCDFLHNQGHEVAVHDTATADSPFAQFESLAEGVAWAQLTVVSAPLGVSPGILEQILALEPAGVVFDICSIKKDVVGHLRRGASSGLSVTSVHPLFGPDTVTLYGRNVVVCPCGNAAADELARSLFSETAAKLVVLTPEEHDRLMSLSLGITHALNLVFARALATSGASYAELLSVASSSFTKQIGTTREVAGENMDLYFEIQRQCDTGAIFDGLSRELETIRSLVVEGEREGFCAAMEQAKRFFDEKADAID
jgi:chorismate mutase/prephenate dehydrogenase